MHELPVREVVLRPDGAASFNAVYVDAGMVKHPPCVHSVGELVTPPGARVPLRVAEPGGKYCGLGVMVTPLVPGRLDRYMAG